MNLGIDLAERGWVPDPVMRWGIRRLLRQRLRDDRPTGADERRRARARLVDEMRTGPVAIDTDAANEQHYEVPARFFREVLGRWMKYSSGFWPEGVDDLEASEEAMLERTLDRAGVEDGMRVLDLGCGWGSLTLYGARRFPGSRWLAVSNSSSQREFILDRARELGLTNVEAVTADMNHFDPERRFDRVVSVEMFEHMRNLETLLGRIAGWLEPHGRLFVHVFCHRDHPYFFHTDGRNDWMARYFFTGGYMPSDDLFRQFDRDLVVERQWKVNGRHYERTLRAWLERMDSRRERVLGILREAYGSEEEAQRWWHRWRMFFLACAELFGFRGGEEWFVSHYLFRPAREGRA
jgi:cyclopropane-fatty-acyl-phospholipid synthase